VTRERIAEQAALHCREPLSGSGHPRLVNQRQLMAGRLAVPVVPIRLRGVEQILHRHTHWPRPGRVEITFGAPLQLKGEDYAALAKQVEEAVRAL
jgi:1-acyl-sn-glycerol-3-phosphate acyltransferase